jgi:hypothetical protein
MSCERCPIPDSCAKLAGFCAWAAEEPQDPVKIAAIKARAQAPSSFPSLIVQAGNVMGAAARIAAAIIHGKPVKVSTEERDRRWGLCTACENLVNDRCKLCGCHFRAKIELATERCPMEPPLWDRVEETA